MECCICIPEWNNLQYILVEKSRESCSRTRFLGWLVMTNCGIIFVIYIFCIVDKL